MHETARDPFPYKVWAALAVLNLVAAVLSVPYSRELLAQVPGSQGALVSTFPKALALSIAQALLLALPAAALGLHLGRPIGLGAPLLEAWLGRGAERSAIGRTLFAGAVTGLGLGVVLLVGGLPLDPWFAAEQARLGTHVPEHPSALAGVLGSFGAGISEETLLRLFLLTALYRLLLPLAGQRSTGFTPRSAFWIANLASAVVFGVLHFGNVWALGLPLTVLQASVALFGNGIVGLACGVLYERRGIESAMAAHTVTDLVIHGLAPALGWV